MVYIYMDETADTVSWSYLVFLGLRSCFFLVDAPRRLVGEDLCRRVATLLVACLSEPRLNRELALLLLDYTVSQLADVRL